MNESVAGPGAPGMPGGIRTVFHPSDFTEGGRSAFAHALRLAVENRATFDILHANPDNMYEVWQDFPGVRATLERWKLLPGDDRSAGLLLEDILTAQDRLMEEESSFLRAQVDYAPYTLLPP